MKDIQQLIKKNSQEGRYEDIFPKTFIDAVEDRESGNNLTEILSGFNMYFLSYNGSREQTRLQVPMSIRKTGLWITYVLYDKTVVTEWYAGEAIDDDSWKSSDNWRVGTNMLVGDISISSDGYWVINGVVTTTKAQGEQGITPMLRVGSNNHLQVSYTNGSSWVDVSTNPVYTQFRVHDNKLQQSTDLGESWSNISEELAYQFRNSGNKLQVSKDLGITWEDTSDYIAAWFRFTGTSESSQADNIGKIQISRDNGTTWSDLSGEFTNSLHIKGYVATVSALPSTAIQGDIYGVGPTYDPSDTEQTNPIYQLYVKDSTGWVNNGRFTSISAGIVQELGNSETAVMSQAATTKAIYEILYDVSSHNDGAVFESLSALLGSANLSTLIPTSVRRGGMSIRFVQSSDNKYVQARLMAQNFTTDITQWQGVDDEPTAGSQNLITSGGVAGKFEKVEQYLEPIITFEDLPRRGGFLTINGSMVNITTCSHIIISIKPNDIITVQKGQNNGFLCFLKNYVAVTSATDYNAYICNGASRQEFNNLKTYIAPSDAKFLYVATNNEGVDVSPSILKVNNIDYIDGLYNQVSSIQKDVDENTKNTIILSNDKIFNSIVRELYFLGISYTEIKYYSISVASSVYSLHLQNENHQNIINISITNNKILYTSIVAQVPIGNLIECYAIINTDKLQVIQDTEIVLYSGNNLYNSPGILSKLLIDNEDSLRKIDLSNNSVGYVNANGTITNHANSRHCASVPIKKGDLVRVHATETNGAYVISYCDEEQSTFDPVIPYSGVDNDDYIFISQKDGFITISWHNLYLCYATIISSKVFGELIGSGKSAYQIAVDNGFEGTEQEWLNSLKGEDGAPGTPGIRGEQGLQGNSGYSGAAGELEVVNNLTEGGATKALSAEQGKIIGNYINYNNIPIVSHKVNPISIVEIRPLHSNWNNLDSDGSVSSNEVDIYDEVYQINRSCVELNSNNSGRFAAALGTSINMSNNVLRMSVCLQKTLDVSELGTLSILLFSNNLYDATHRAQFMEQYANRSEGGGTYNQQYTRGGWFHFCVNPQPLLTNVGSSFDITNVTAVGIHLYYNGSIKIYVSDISIVNSMLQKGIINIVDNFDPNVPNMADYAFSKGVKLNLSIVPNWIGGSASASLAEINRCKRQGHFIFNHTFNHITDVSGLTEQQIVEEITKSNSWMVSNGFARGAKCISNPSAAFPFSKYKAYMESPADIIFHHWTTMGSNGTLLYYPYYPMSRLLTISALDNNSSSHEQAQTTLQRMKSSIDLAQSKGGIAVIGSHGTFWSADDGETWKELIDYIATKTDMISFGIDDVIEGNFV